MIARVDRDCEEVNITSTKRSRPISSASRPTQGHSLSFASIRSQSGGHHSRGTSRVDLFSFGPQTSSSVRSFDPGVNWHALSLATAARAGVSNSNKKYVSLLALPDPNCPKCFPDFSRWAKYLPQRKLCPRCADQKERTSDDPLSSASLLAPQSTDESLSTISSTRISERGQPLPASSEKFPMVPNEAHTRCRMIAQTN